VEGIGSAENRWAYGELPETAAISFPDPEEDGWDLVGSSGRK